MLSCRRVCCFIINCMLPTLGLSFSHAISSSRFTVPIIVTAEIELINNSDFRQTLQCCYWMAMGECVAMGVCEREIEIMCAELIYINHICIHCMLINAHEYTWSTGENLISALHSWAHLNYFDPTMKLDVVNWFTHLEHMCKPIFFLFTKFNATETFQ